MEPSLSEGVDRGKNDGASSSPAHEEDTDSSTGTKMFVPKRSGQKKISKKDDVASTTLEVLNLIKDDVKNDPTKELMRSEMAQSREHEMSILQALLRTNSNVGCNSQMNPSSSMYRSSWECDPPVGHPTYYRM